MRVDAGAFGHKYQSKPEVFRFCTHDCGMYLPKYDAVTIWHMRDLIARSRTRIKQTAVQHIQVPRFEGLKIETMLAYAADKPEVMACLPSVRREREALPRQYLANVIYTIVKEPFKNWVNAIVDERHEERRKEEDIIMMDPEIAAVFNAS